MSVWRSSVAESGRKYYYKTGTNETSWVKPEGFEEADAPAPPADPAVIDVSWKEAKTPEGRPYYYNSITKKTVWNAPEAYLRHQQQQQSAQPAAPAFVAGGGQGFGGGRDEYPARERRMERRDERVSHLPQKPAFDGGRERGMPWENRQESTGFRGPMPVKTDEPEYATTEQAEEAFFKLLKKHGISPDTTWEDALRVVIKEREFRALKDPKERRQAFEKYCIEVRVQEKSKEKERKERLREDFRKMLSTHDDILHYTRWKTARPSIEREAVFKQAGDEDERRQMFDEYILELKRRHAEEQIEDRKVAMQELDSLLKAVVVDPDTTWNEAQKRITTNERFTSDDIFRSLHNVDILTAFDAHVKELDRIRNDAKQKEKRLHTRRERQARDAFKQLLAQMLAEGKIKAGTKWQTFLPLIAEDERYTKLIGTPGSSPLDLFWDVVEDEERKLRSKRNNALDVLEETRYEMTTQTTLSDFADVMRSDPRTAGLNQEEIQMIYDRLMEKILRRAEEDKLQDERAKRKAIDALRSVIKHLEPPVRLGDMYEDVAPKLQGYEEFQVLDDDEGRRSAFEKHMRRLKEKEQDDLDRERARRDRDRDHRNGSRRDRGDDRDRRHRTRTPEVDAYEADRRKAQADRERLYRKASFGLTPPPREREREREPRREVDRYEDGGGRRRHERGESIYDRERREREMERERNYISRADPRDKGRTLDYGDEDAVGSISRPGSVRKRRESDAVSVARESKRARRTRTPEVQPAVQEEPPALQSGSEEGEIEEI